MKKGAARATRVPTTSSHPVPPIVEAASLQIRDVSKSYRTPDGASMLVLDRISLSITAGEMVALIGPSGCGKSTLLRLIAGLDQPSSGGLWAGPERVTGPGAERGLMFQNANLFPWLTIRRNIQAALVARGLFDRRREEVEELMRLTGLEEFADVYPHQVSGGMAQRAALARALINHPKILLLDEPLGALDQFTRMRMQDEVLRLWQSRATTMVLVTHDIDEALYMSDRIVIMTPRPGRIERVIQVPLERPRQRSDHDFLELRGEILEMLHFAGNEPSEAKRLARSPSPPATTPSGHRLDAQVVIIGGGPGGSTLGNYLSRAGVDTLILDKAVHPRRHVGESLVCSTTKILQEIDLLPAMEREGFTHKHGASWVHWAEPRPRLIRFREIPEMSITQDYTYHVDRGRFDKLLLEQAELSGSRILQGAHVQRVEFGPDGAARGVTLQHGGVQRTLRCRIVVDASGRSCVLGTQLRLKRKDPRFNQFALHSWFEGVDRGPGETADFIHMYILPSPRSWAWQIPISAGVTSVGIVTSGPEFVKRGESMDDFFARHIASNPVLAGRLAGARKIQEFTREGNYSYVMDRFVGDGWLLVGDAARFVDPVFSSGVSVAMESAKRAARAIRDALDRDDVRAGHFASYEAAQRAAVDIWLEFILLYYRLPPLFLDLVDRPDSRVQLMRLLQGEVYDRESVPILEEMRATVERAERGGSLEWERYLGAEARSSESIPTGAAD